MNTAMNHGNWLDAKSAQRKPEPFESDPRYITLKERFVFAAQNNALPSYFTPHDGINNGTTAIAGKDLVNFSSYNYLALSGNEYVARKAKEAIDTFGTSVSASRIISGEIQLHRELEAALASFIGVEDCVTMVSGHATNVGIIGHLFGKNDLICHDALSHNSILEGCRLSGAVRLSFRHNDCEHLETLLDKHRHEFERVLIVVEGVYSQDGDIADLPGIIEIKERYNAILMVDEAHSIGVLGRGGRGVSEHYGVAPSKVDIWMGTLSKSFASCGGYIAGSRSFIAFLKYTLPGFIFSAGMPPSSAAAALAALQVIKDQPERLQQLASRAALFLECAKAQGLNTGLSSGTPIIPVITKNSVRTLRLSEALRAHGVSAYPIVYPAVEEEAARIRFFVAADHTEEQIRYSVAKTAEEYFRLKDG